LRDRPAVSYSAVGGLLFVLVLWGPTAAFRSIVWILVFAVLLAFGVTMLRRQTALEFHGIAHGQALRDFREQRAAAHSRKSTPPLSTRPRTAGPGGSERVDVLERLVALRDRGAITNQEYLAEKAHVMANGT
jgi:hypothetical protein